MKIKISDGTTVIESCSYLYDKDITSVIIPDTVKEIGRYAFCDCENLKHIIGGNDICSIAESAFHHCESLKSLYVPSTVKRIGRYAFAQCESLEYIDFDDTDNIEIGESAFLGCNGLDCLFLPDGLRVIGNKAFYNCKNLQDLYVSSTVEHISSYAFANCNKLETVIMGDSVKIIDNCSFSRCPIVNINFPEGLVEIGHCAFTGGLFTTIVIPDTTVCIRDYTFSECKRMVRVIIGRNAREIGNGTFKHCENLSVVTFKGTDLVTWGRGVFAGCKNLKRINVPASAMDTYKRLLPKYLHRKLVSI